MAAGRQNYSRKSYSNRSEDRFDQRVSVRSTDHIRYDSDCNRAGREPYGSTSQSMRGFDRNSQDRNREGDASGFTKKRKFSPVVWDRVEKQVKIVSKNGLLPAGSVLNQSCVVKSSNDFVKLKDCDRDLTIEKCSVSSVESVVSNVSDGVEGPNSLAIHEVHDIEPENEEGEFVEERKLSKSKWAFEDSPRIESGVNNSSPESGEFTRECSESKQDVSSLSTEDGLFANHSSEDERSENVPEKVISSPEDYSDDDEEMMCTGLGMLPSCRNADVYKRVKEIGVGTYGVVHQAVDKKTGEIVALKKVKMGDTREGFPITALREINILATLQHPSIVEVKEVVMDDFNGVYMVMEHVDNELKKYMDYMKHPFSQSEVKCLMIQLLEGMSYLHDNWVIHRDLKTSNLLLTDKGELKICDFGMARRYVSPEKPYTSLVVTLWYRAPEVLLGMKQYSTAIDMWSVGCIMAELLSKKPLFDGNKELEQIDKIFRTLGTPNESIWPGYSKLPGVKPNFPRQPFNTLRKKFPVASFTGAPSLTELGFDLLNKFLTYDPKKRITAEEALNHGWFREAPLPAEKEVTRIKKNEDPDDSHYIVNDRVKGRLKRRVDNFMEKFPDGDPAQHLIEELL